MRYSEQVSTAPPLRPISSIDNSLTVAKQPDISGSIDSLVLLPHPQFHGRRGRFKNTGDSHTFLSEYTHGNYGKDDYSMYQSIYIRTECSATSITKALLRYRGYNEYINGTRLPLACQCRKHSRFVCFNDIFNHRND